MILMIEDCFFFDAIIIGIYNGYLYFLPYLWGTQKWDMHNNYIQNVFH